MRAQRLAMCHKGQLFGKGRGFFRNNFQTRPDNPSQSGVLAVASSEPVVDHCTCKVPGVGSIPGTMPQSSGRLAQNLTIFSFIFSQLMMKVLKVLGHPRRRGVPANPHPRPSDPPPLLPPLLIHYRPHTHLV